MNYPFKQRIWLYVLVIENKYIYVTIVRHLKHLKMDYIIN